MGAGEDGEATVVVVDTMAAATTTVEAADMIMDVVATEAEVDPITIVVGMVVNLLFNLLQGFHLRASILLQDFLQD